MSSATPLEALMHSYQDFNTGNLQRNFDMDKSNQLVKKPVDRYSYALVRAALNVFVQQNFADQLNLLAFDCDSFHTDVMRYVPEVWPGYLEEAQAQLRRATVHTLETIQFSNWGSTSEKNCFGAWHRMDFREFQVNVLFQVSNQEARLGQFEGFCGLENDRSTDFALPERQLDTCHLLGSPHLQTVIDEMLPSLGIAMTAAIAAIKSRFL